MQVICRFRRKQVGLIGFAVCRLVVAGLKLSGQQSVCPVLVITSPLTNSVSADSLPL
jgi:hypothetical protein